MRLTGLGALITASVGLYLLRTLYGSADTATLNVDNITAEVWQVWVDGEEAGSVKPFEVGVFRRPPGSHEVRVTAGGKELDRARTELPRARTTVFNPEGRASYIRHVAVYAGGLVMPLCPVGVPIDVVTGKSVIQVDFGPAERMPERLETIDSVNLTKLVRVPPAAFDPATAAGYIRAPRELYDYRPESYVEAVRAILKALPTTDGMATVCLALESDESSIVGPGFMAVWQTGALLPEDRLVEWMDRPAAGDAVAARLRRAHALLLLLSRGKGDLVRSRCDKLDRDDEIHLARDLRVLPARAYEPLLRECAPVGHARLSLKVIDGALGAEAAIDAPAAKALDALIEKLEPSDRKPRVGVWSRRLASGRDKLDPTYVGLRLLSALQEGCVDRQLIDAVVQMDLGADLASAYARMKSAVRMQVLLQLGHRLGGDRLETAAQLAVFEAGLRDPDPSPRIFSVNRLVEMHRKRGDDRVPGILQRASEQATDIEWKRQLRALRAVLIR